MKRIAPEIDELMWMVAQKGDPRAIRDFELRFPDLKPELGRRTEMVAKFKAAKPDAVLPEFIPAFRRPSAQPSKLSPRTTMLFAAVILAAMAIASYSATKLLFADPPTVYGEAMPKHPKGRSLHIDDKRPKKIVQDPIYPGARLNGDHSTPETPKAGLPEPKKIDMITDKVSLFTVIRAIAQHEGLSVEFAPGMEDREVKISYRQMPAKLILEDLGRRFGFTVLENGQSEVLVIPARDPRGYGGSMTSGGVGSPAID